MSTTKPVATEKQRAMLAKLQALADRGIDGEKIAATKKLERYRNRYDFSAPPERKEEDLFAGTFQRGSTAKPVIAFKAPDFHMENAIRWIIEALAGVHCVYRNGALFAECTDQTAERLTIIARTINDSFSKLWEQFNNVKGITEADRSLFLQGATEGATDYQRALGQPLPTRVAPKAGKARKNSVGMASGIAPHPYTFGLNLGKQVRFSIPLEEISAQIDCLPKKKLAA